jgi:hypothetical protein
MEFVKNSDRTVTAEGAALTAEFVERMLLQDPSISQIKGTDGDTKYPDIASLWKYFHRAKAPEAKAKSKSKPKATAPAAESAAVDPAAVGILDEPEFYKQAFEYSLTAR